MVEGRLGKGGGKQGSVKGPWALKVSLDAGDTVRVLAWSQESREMANAV